MPELPDVENYRRYLHATALHKRIAAVQVRNARILSGISPRRLRQRLTGCRFEATLRRGKQLLVRLDRGGWVTFHFGMTGRFKYFKRLEDDPPHDRLRFDFENGRHLAFDCQRLLGRVGLSDDAAAYLEGRGLGPDALDPKIDEAAFKAALRRRKGQLKSALMDQRLLAGIGNIYSDEILFQARLDPRTKASTLSDRELSTLFAKMREVLRTAIDCGAGSEDAIERLPSGYLLPQRRKGGICPRCGGEIRFLKIAGRTAYVCPACQGRGRATGIGARAPVLR